MRFLVGLAAVVWFVHAAQAEKMRTSHFNAKHHSHAAHKTLPIGTWIRVTNPQNGRSVVLKVAGRGPFIRGRQLDISTAAAHALGFGDKGVLVLEVEVLR